MAERRRSTNARLANVHLVANVQVAHLGGSLALFVFDRDVQPRVIDLRRPIRDLSTAQLVALHAIPVLRTA
eukprot:1003879-Rhodomonas_salina.1